MTERRYDDDEVAAIFLRAAEGPRTSLIHVPRNEGLTLSELQEIGREVGIPADAVAQAAKSLDLRPTAVSQSFLGLPLRVERTLTLNRRLTEDEWENLVVELREVFRARGTLMSYGSLRQWTNGNLHALLEPTPTGHRLRLGTLNGYARSSLRAGLFTIGVAAVTAIATAVNGHIGGAMPGIVFLSVAGMGLFANGALRLPRWARMRRGQMEGITARLALAAEAPPSPPPSIPGA